MREQSFADTASVASSRLSVLSDRKIKVTFRRYYVNDVGDIIRHDNRARLIKEEKLYQESMKAALVPVINASESGGGMPVDSVVVESKESATHEDSHRVTAGAMHNSAEGTLDVHNISASVSPEREDTNKGGSADSTAQQPVAPRPVLLSQQEADWDHEAARIDLVCRTCTSKEVYKGMADLRQQVCFNYMYHYQGKRF